MPPETAIRRRGPYPCLYQRGTDAVPRRYRRGTLTNTTCNLTTCIFTLTLTTCIRTLTSGLQDSYLRHVTKHFKCCSPASPECPMTATVASIGRGGSARCTTGAGGGGAGGGPCAVGCHGIGVCNSKCATSCNGARNAATARQTALQRRKDCVAMAQQSDVAVRCAMLQHVARRCNMSAGMRRGRSASPLALQRQF